MDPVAVAVQTLPDLKPAHADAMERGTHEGDHVPTQLVA